MYDDIANLGIKDGKIAAIAKDTIKSKQTIDATGLVVAPGFIDTHHHAVGPFGTRMALRDGLTTGIGMQEGATSMARWHEDEAKSGWPLNYSTPYLTIVIRPGCALKQHPATPFRCKTHLHSRTRTSDAIYTFLPAAAERGITEETTALRQLIFLSFRSNDHVVERRGGVLYLPGLSLRGIVTPSSKETQKVKEPC